jgi:hypothetical protein
MERIKIAKEYDQKWLEVERPQPLCDPYLENLFASFFHSKPQDHSILVHETFKNLANDWIFKSKLNNLLGIDQFPEVDIMSGCTQFIDNIYMQGQVQVIRSDYRYHERLGKAIISDVEKLIPGIPLILSTPFPSLGAPHPYLDRILEEAHRKNIDVHIDGAWITCCRFINFNFDHPAIKSVGISLSKGLGLGWNRIGLRWSRERTSDSISIMNDFHMQNRILSMMANHILKNVDSDYLWNRYGKVNEKICKDFNLIQSNAIHVAWTNQKTLVGLSPLIRYLINE